MPAKDMLTAILSKGYFPKELPPTFTTTDFGAHSWDILAEWKDKGLFKVKPLKGLRNAYTYEGLSGDIEPEAISTPKRGHERRSMHITHPLPQLLLSYELTANWSHVQKWLSRRLYSDDEIRIGSDFDRSIKGINFKLHEAKKAYIEAEADWIVRTDVTRFYPSIYTHSIPWAAYGKAKVKGSRKLYEGSLAARIDALVRCCNRGQTIGIPIGPETSRIIAEVISSRVDDQFSYEAIVERSKVDRLQDDWFVGAASFEAAEAALSKISSVYREFGLDINGSKTSLGHVKTQNNVDWTSELEAFLSHRIGPLAGSRLREFVSLALRLQEQVGQETPIKYALTALESVGWTEEDVNIVESFLIKSANVAPGSLEAIARILINQRYANAKLSLSRIVNRFSELVLKNFERENHYEVIWLLFAIRGLKRPLSLKLICDAIEDTPSSTIALLLLDMQSQGILLSQLPKQTWEMRVTEERVKSDWSWLVAYEAIRRGWLRDPKGVLGKPFFAALNSRNIRFYDPSRNVLFSRAHVKARRIAGRRDAKAAKKLVMQLRGLTSSVYGID